MELTFSGDLLGIGAVVVVTDQVEQSWTTGETVLDGNTASVAIAGDMPDGAYTVNWRVVSGDGHPISGSVPFTVGTVAAVPVGGSSATPAGGPAASEPERPATAGESEGENRVPRVVVVGGCGAVAALLLLYSTWRHSVHRCRARAPSAGAE